MYHLTLRKLIICILCTLACMTSDLHAQSVQQQAIIKTRGKLSLTGEKIPGRRIQGAFVKIKNGNIHESDTLGQISFPVPGGRYHIESVRYKDFVLVDADELNKEQAYSKEPKSIVISSIWEMNEDQLEEERRMREQAEKRYRASLAEIRRLEEELKISADSANVLLEALNEARQQEEYLIKDLARHYSKIDFDYTDEFNDEWALYIRTGQLDKADSLLKTSKGLVLMETEYQSMRSGNERGRALIARQEEVLIENKSLQASNEDKEYELMHALADRYYKHFEIAALRHKQDSALIYLEKRAALDTTRTSWQFLAGYYAYYLNDFEKAEHYYLRSLTHGEHAKFILLNMLGTLYTVTGRYAESEAAFMEAIEAYHNSDVNDSEILAECINNLGNLYFETGRFDKAETAYEEALGICRDLVETNPQAYAPYYALSLTNIGLVYLRTHQYEKCETSYNEALEVYRRLAKDAPQMYEADHAHLLNRIGILYKETSRYDDSDAAYKEALEIYRRLAKENPMTYEPKLAMTLVNAGTLYVELRYTQEAILMYQEAIEIIRRLAKDNPNVYEPDLAIALSNLACSYDDLRHYEKSGPLHMEALEIRGRLVERHPHTYLPYYAACLNNYGNWHYHTGRFDESEALYLEALEIYREICKTAPKVYEPKYLGTLRNLAQLYFKTKRFSECIPIHMQCVSVARKKAEEDPANFMYVLALELNDLAFMQIMNKDFSSGEQTARESSNIYKENPFAHIHIANALLFQGKYAEAQQIYKEHKLLREYFLNDFVLYEKNGIIPEEYRQRVESIKGLLNE